MSRCAPGCQRAAALARELLAHARPRRCSESTSTPSRSKTTATITARRTAGRRRRALPDRARARASRPRRRRSRGRRRSTRSIVSATIQPTAPSSEERLVVPHRDPVPLDERRHAAREVLGEVLLVAGEDRDPPLAGLVEHLEDRRRPAERDGDERRRRARPRRATRRSAPPSARPTPRRRPTHPAATAGRAPAAPPSTPRAEALSAPARGSP